MLKKLIERFQDRTKLPIEVDEIAAEIAALGLQDEINFYHIGADPAQIRGAFYQFTHRPGVYAEPVLVTLVPYNDDDPLEWQRVVCCKEMMHIFDSDLERTDTEEQVPEFLDKLLGPLSTDDFGAADFMAAKDKVALYQCLPLLLPRAALQIARKAVADDLKTAEEIARWAGIPVNLVIMMLQEDWDTINGALIDY
jgi:hypothetical protein